MLIYGVSGIFAHKKTIKQFLQPMIEQVFGGGGGGREGGRWMCCFFASVFQSYCIFVSAFFNSPMPFLGRFYQYLHISCCILCAFHQKVKQCFGHVMYKCTIDPQFSKISSLALILEGNVGSKLPNRWILIQQ